MAEVCYKCNKPARTSAKFCASCGARLDIVVPASNGNTFVASKPPPPVSYSTPSNTSSSRAKSVILSPSLSTSSSSPAPYRSSVIMSSAPKSSLSPPLSLSSSAPKPTAPITTSVTSKFSPGLKPTSASSPSSIVLKPAATSPSFSPALKPTSASSANTSTSKSIPFTTTRSLASSAPIPSTSSPSSISPGTSLRSTGGPSRALSPPPSTPSDGTDALHKTINSLRPLALSSSTPTSPADKRLSILEKQSTSLRSSAGAVVSSSSSSPSSTTSPRSTQQSSLSPRAQTNGSMGPPAFASARRTTVSVTTKDAPTAPVPNNAGASSTPKHVSSPPTPTSSQQRLSTYAPSPVRLSAPAQAAAPIHATPPPPPPKPTNSTLNLEELKANKSHARTTSKESKEVKEVTKEAKEIKEAREAKEAKEAKEAREKEVRDAKETKEKEVRDAKESKEREAKEAKEAREAKLAKEAKEAREAKEAKQAKEPKEAAELKEGKDLRESSEEIKVKHTGRDGERATISASLTTKMMPGDLARSLSPDLEAERKRKASIKGMFASIIKRELKESEETEQGGESATSSSPTIESKHRKSQELRLSDSGDLRTEEEPQRRKWFIKKAELSLVNPGLSYRKEPSQDALSSTLSRAATPLSPSPTRAKSSTLSSSSSSLPSAVPSPTSTPSPIPRATSPIPISASPLPLASSPTPSSPLATSPVPERKKDIRELVIDEILRTEESYLKDLETIVMMKQLMKEDDVVKEVVTSEDVSAIFSVVEQLLALNTELNKIFAQGKDGASIGLGFISMAAYLKMYSVYCGNQNKSLDTLIRLRHRKEFQSFLTVLAARPECRSLGLEDFLIKPVQRVCKYPLLLRELIKATPPTHADAETLQTAADKIGDIVADVNEKKRIFENLQAMYDVQMLLEDSGEEINILDPSRQLIREGRIGYVPRDCIPTLNTSNPTIREGYFFMFNNLFLCMKRTVMGSQKLKIFIPLDKALIPPKVPFKSELPVFQVVEAGKAVWSFVAQSEEECTTLSDIMTKYIDDILRKKYLEDQDKHKAMQITLEDFMKSHRDKPLPPPPPPKNKPPTRERGSAPSSPATLRASAASPPPKPPRPEAKEEEEQKRKSLPPVPKSNTASIKFVCVNQEKRMVELPRANPLYSQLKDKLQSKLLLQGSFVISRHHGGKAINSQTDLDTYLEEYKEILHLGVEIDVIQL